MSEPETQVFYTSTLLLGLPILQGGVVSLEKESYTKSH